MCNGISINEFRPCTAPETSALASVISAPGSSQPATPHIPSSSVWYCVQSSSWTGLLCGLCEDGLDEASRSSEAIDSSSEACRERLLVLMAERVDAFLSVELERSHHWRIG